MTEPYRRTGQQRQNDFLEARIWEEEVAGLFVENGLGGFRTDFEAKDRLDFWLPGVYVELKEKKQKYTKRWHLLENVPEQDLFIIDELTVRRSLQHYPNVLFLLRDIPAQRMFHVPVWELVSAERARVNRVAKGKWIVDVQNFRQGTDPAGSVELFKGELVNEAWKTPSIATHKEVPQA